jgi:anti-sigma B factor antagonist
LKKTRAASTFLNSTVASIPIHLRGQGFEKKIFQAIDDGSKSMIIDFGELEYISSAGLRVILKATKALKREEGKMMLCDMQDYVKEVFEIAGFDSFLPIVGTMDDALQSF